MSELLIDFGASRIKSAVCDLNKKEIKHIKSNKAIRPVFYLDGRCEVSPEAISDKFKEILLYHYKDLGEKFESIYISSEMHGFLLLDKNQNPISQYISWRDERSLQQINKMQSFSELKNLLGDSFKKITGMNARPGLPVFNAYHMLKTNSFEDIKLVSLPEWLALVSKDSTNICHETLAAGTGFYDINRKCISSQILSKFKEISAKKILFNEITGKTGISGYWHIDDKKIPIYTGVGDHQCAVLGAGNTEQTISVNLGTGSQIAAIDYATENKNIEFRPFFDNKNLSCITHIPSGRALNEYIGFLEEIKSFSKEKQSFWDMLAGIKIDEIKSSTLVFDLAIFPSAYNYKNNQGISGITQNSLNVKNYISSLAKSYADQYVEILSDFMNNKQMSKIILSGGISRKISVLKDYLQQKTSISTEVSKFTEETFLGLMVLALANKEKVSCKEAQKILLNKVIIQE